MNTQVSATGMKVKAEASGGLLISTYDSTKTGDERFGDGFKASAAALITDVTTISPISTIDAKNGIQHKLKMYLVMQKNHLIVIQKLLAVIII